MADGSLSQFKATLARRKARKEKNGGKFDKSSLDYKRSNSKTEYDFPKLNESELGSLKKKIRTNIRKQERKDFILFVCVMGLVLILFFSLVN